MDRESPSAAPRKLDPEDYYFEGPLTVFTAAYHLKRGYCCGSRCRHCPYGNGPTSPGDNAEEATSDRRSED